jgi:hypothetical protein
MKIIGQTIAQIKASRLHQGNVSAIIQNEDHL